MYEELKKRAESGDAEAQYELASAYHTDRVHDGKDGDKEAVFWYGKAAAQGHTEAEYYFAHCIRCGVGVRFSNAEGSLPYYLSAAKKGHQEAMKELFELYSGGLSCEKWDYDKAYYWIKTAAELGDAEAEYELGKLYTEGFTLPSVKKYKFRTDPAEGVKWLKKSAAQNYLFAAKAVGDCYAKGLGVEKDERKALEWYEKGGERDGEALRVIAERYFSGDGVPQSYEKAFGYFTRAADNFDVAARKRVGDCYFYGYGVEKDLDKALENYILAAKNDDYDFHGAKSALALLYAKDTPYRNEREAVISLNQTKNFTNNPEIFYEVGKRHLVGSDFRDGEHTYECYVIRKDKESAEHWLKKAADGGNAEAKELLKRLK